MKITFGSVCSGIEAASVAWGPLGFKAEWFSEIEKFPCEVLRHHWPHVTNLGSMLSIPDKIVLGGVKPPLILVGGTPCQSFSVAGKQLGLDDERGQLTLAYVDIMNAIDNERGEGDECVCVWENVPGVLSDKGNAFGFFLGKLAGEDGQLIPSGPKWSNTGCVFGPQRAIAWRVMDAQYFGVAQRRRRVFLVASARKGFDPTKVLFESEGVRRDIAPSREKKQSLTSGFRMCAFGEYADDETASTMKARDYKDASDLVTLPINTMTMGGRPSDDLRPRMGLGIGKHNDPQNTLTKGHSHAVFDSASMAIRRLTPTECERLQGFPDGHTLINSKTPDGHRYKALGNSMAVPCMAWIAKRLKQELENNAKT